MVEGVRITLKKVLWKWTVGEGCGKAGIFCGVVAVLWWRAMGHGMDIIMMARRDCNRSDSSGAASSMNLFTKSESGIVRLARSVGVVGNGMAVGLGVSVRNWQVCGHVWELLHSTEWWIGWPCEVRERRNLPESGHKKRNLLIFHCVIPFGFGGWASAEFNF
jgi:hypothetical protein